MNRPQTRHLIGGGVGMAILFLLPCFLPDIRIHIFTEVLIYALFAIGFNLLFGYTGLLPFGAAALFGVGAYVAALILNHFPGTPLLLALMMAAVGGLVAAAIIGFFCVRLSGAYFALSTLAFQMFLFAVAWKWRSFTRGDDGIGVTRPDLHLPVLGSISLKSIDNMYYLTLIIVAIAILACYLFLKTPLGNSAICVREKDVRASFLGINVFMVKLIAFSAAGVLLGLAGGLFAIYQGFIATTCMDLNMGMTPVLMTIIGGSGQFLGPVLGAAFYVVFQDWISSLTSYWMIIMGSIFVIVVLYLEGGLISLFDIEKIRRWRHWGSK
jgi:branched-chain amino acid transport system permease protein